MRKIGDDLWVHDDSMKMVGTRLGLRMTVAKLTGGGVWVHSPTAISPELRREIDEIGTVECIVAASNAHNLWLQDWCEAYPDADVYVSAGIPRKVPLSKYHILQRGMENPWEADFDWETMPSVPMFNETVFLHKKTSSVIVTDLIQNYSDELPSGFAGVMTKYVFQPIGFKGTCIAPPLRIGYMIKDKPMFTNFIRHVQEWDFERIIVTHGDIIEDNAKSVFTDLCTRFLK
ncbi:DUF4336 domain-containing protein [uncultured Photobacterium sp.]|uniref:DUF4336 domain-containing protein n=1 Tax=uncultured Photobacterium sp. TaxID=173973 RepID=UPI00263982D2|nr:DUF4336 domain-containing protein [uncultured Photobacterium sp.]